MHPPFLTMNREWTRMDANGWRGLTAAACLSVGPGHTHSNFGSTRRFRCRDAACRVSPGVAGGNSGLFRDGACPVSTKSWRKAPIFYALALSVILLGVVVRAEPEQESVEHAAPAPTEQQMRNAAAEFERRGEPLRAAEWYERLLATNAPANAVVRARLVDIYVEAGRTNEALAQAKVEMKARPDPAAYYATTLSRLGRRAEAESLLDRELAVETNATRRARLEAQRNGPGERR